MKPTGNPYAMPLPSNIPWKSECMRWPMTNWQNGVMEFSAPNSIQDPYTRRTAKLHKRKSKIIPPLPNKQFISEEKVIAHFSGMHISQNFTEHSAGGSTSNVAPNASSMEYDFTNPITQKELEEKLKNANRITVCEEIKKLHALHSSFIPNALIQNRIERPCTALVLWTPPAKIKDLLSEGSENKKSNDFDTLDDDNEEGGEDNSNFINCILNSMDASVADGMDTDL